jgi:hypothetical protein
MEIHDINLTYATIFLFEFLSSLARRIFLLIRSNPLGNTSASCLEVLVSNHGSKSGYPDWGVSIGFLNTSRKVQRHYIELCHYSFHLNLFNSLFTNKHTVQRGVTCVLETSSLTNLRNQVNMTIIIYAYFRT